MRDKVKFAVEPQLLKLSQKVEKIGQHNMDFLAEHNKSKLTIWGNPLVGKIETPMRLSTQEGKIKCWASKLRKKPTCEETPMVEHQKFGWAPPKIFYKKTSSPHCKH